MIKKIFKNLKNISQDFFINSFWKSWPIVIILVLSLILNALLWYIFKTKINQNSLPFIFASGLIFLNLILGNYLWEKEKIASYFLVFVGLFIQLMMLVFVKFLIMVF